MIITTISLTNLKYVMLIWEILIDVSDTFWDATKLELYTNEGFE